MNGKQLTTLSWIQRFADVAPDMKLQHALSMASDIANQFENMINDAEALAILSTTKVGLDDNGNYPEDLENERDAVKWAIGRAQYRHGWVTIGPISNGMDRLLEEKDTLFKKGK